MTWCLWKDIIIIIMFLFIWDFTWIAQIEISIETYVSDVLGFWAWFMKNKIIRIISISIILYHLHFGCLKWRAVSTARCNSLELSVFLYHMLLYWMRTHTCACPAAQGSEGSTRTSEHQNIRRVRLKFDLHALSACGACSNEQWPALTPNNVITHPSSSGKVQPPDPRPFPLAHTSTNHGFSGCLITRKKITETQGKHTWLNGMTSIYTRPAVCIKPT